MTGVADRVAEAMAAELRADAVGAAVLWLSNSHPDVVSPWTRRSVCARTMTASVYEQAAVLGLVGCARCGDRGCDWCQPLAVFTPACEVVVRRGV